MRQKILPVLGILILSSPLFMAFYAGICFHDGDGVALPLFSASFICLFSFIKHLIVGFMKGFEEEAMRQEDAEQ